MVVDLSSGFLLYIPHLLRLFPSVIPISFDEFCLPGMPLDSPRLLGCSSHSITIAFASSPRISRSSLASFFCSTRLAMSRRRAAVRRSRRRPSWTSKSGASEIDADDPRRPSHVLFSVASCSSSSSEVPKISIMSGGHNGLLLEMMRPRVVERCTDHGQSAASFPAVEDVLHHRVYGMGVGMQNWNLTSGTELQIYRPRSRARGRSKPKHALIGQ